MKNVPKAALVILLHLAIIGTLYAKYSYERATRPRVWVKTIGYDPDLPIRGRYVALSLEVATDVAAKKEGDPKYAWYGTYPVHIELRNGELFAANDPAGDEYLTFRELQTTPHAILSEPVLYFISDNAENPTWRPRNQELWAEVTIPKKGPPRPIRLGVKTSGAIEPLNLN
ncbi:MAG: hypothetical protein ACJ71N_03480 [Terriglobales bacterium]|jgi:hypothetical protein